MQEARENASQAPMELAGMLADVDWLRASEFSEVEWRRLVFLRWLFRTGRLTEWI